MRGLTPAEVAELVELSGLSGPDRVFTDDGTEETLFGLVAQGRALHFVETDATGEEWDCFQISPAGQAALELHLRLVAMGAA